MLRTPARLLLSIGLALGALGAWSGSTAPDEPAALREAVGELPADTPAADELRLAAMLSDAGARIGWLLDRAEAAGRPADQRTAILDETEKLLTRFQAGGALPAERAAPLAARLASVRSASAGPDPVQPQPDPVQPDPTAGGTTGGATGATALLALSGAELAAAIRSVGSGELSRLGEADKFSLFARGVSSARLGLPTSLTGNWSNLNPWWHVPALVVSELSRAEPPTTSRLVQLDDGLRKYEAARGATLRNHFSYPSFVVARMLLDRALGLEPDGGVETAVRGFAAPDNTRPRWSLLAQRLSGAGSDAGGVWNSTIRPVIAVETNADDAWPLVEQWLTGRSVGGPTSAFRDTAGVQAIAAETQAFKQAWSSQNPAQILVAMQKVKQARAGISGPIVTDVGSIQADNTLLGLLRNPAFPTEPVVHMFVETLVVDGQCYGVCVATRLRRLQGTTFADPNLLNAPDLAGVIQQAMASIGSAEANPVPDHQARVLIGLDCAPARSIIGASRGWMGGIRATGQHDSLIAITPSIAALRSDGGGWNLDAALRFYVRSVRGPAESLEYRLSRSAISSLQTEGIGAAHGAFLIAVSSGGGRFSYPHGNTLKVVNQNSIRPQEAGSAAILPLILPIPR